MTPTLDTVKAYYDERIDGKIRDFTHANPRIEAAIQTIAEWAPAAPKRILEIGCGIGATSWRMARAWPHAEVVGADVSPASIRVARACFRRPNLRYHEGLIASDTFQGSFDLVVLMDTYEHIAQEDRPSLHATIRSLRAEEARVILTVPTPALQALGRREQPTAMQPVDEDVTPTDLMRLAAETAMQLVYYREVGIWQYGDYAHVVLGLFQQLAEVAARLPKASGVAAIKESLQRLVDGPVDRLQARCNYLGSDMLVDSHGRITRRFDVSFRERRQLVSPWLDRRNR